MIESFESIASSLVLQGNFSNVTSTQENVALVAERVSFIAVLGILNVFIFKCTLNS